MIKRWLQLCIYVCFLNLCAYKAVVVVPVADLFGQPVQEFNADHNFYFSLPYSPESGAFCCPRVYQLLFNEVVEVEQELETECKITYNGAFYIKQGKPCNEFYISKKCLCPFDAIDPHTIPHTPDIMEVETPATSDEIVLLDPVTINSVNFSAGTRFKLCKELNSLELSAQELNTGYIVYCLDTILAIPKDNALRVDHTASLEEKIALFVRILQRWAHNETGFIPYALGGASNAYYIPHESEFTLVQQDAKSFWSYPDYEYPTKSGMDCSALIIRAAQTAGLPFFYRNTTTINHYLQPLTKDVSIQAGDIIWFKGHVIVVSDVERNLCIEARGYASGFGKVQEIALQDLFIGIQTFDELKEAFIHQSGLQLIDRARKLSTKVSEFTILALALSFRTIQTQLDAVRAYLPYGAAHTASDT